MKMLLTETDGDQCELQRRKRENLQFHFSYLRDSVPALHSENVVNKAQILKKAIEYIRYMKKKSIFQQQDIDGLIQQNARLDYQIRMLEKAITTGNFTPLANEIKRDTDYQRENESEASDSQDTMNRPKKLKLSARGLN